MAPGIDRGGAAGGLLDPVRLRTVLRHLALVHAGAYSSLRVRSGTYEACPSPRKVTGGWPTLDRLVEMSTNGGPSRSSRSSSDHGRSSQGRGSRSREPTPPQLMNFSIDDFTVVCHTKDSFTFTSAHPVFPGGRGSPQGPGPEHTVCTQPGGGTAG